METCQFVRTVFKKLFILLLTIVTVVGAVIVVPMLIPVYIFRYVLSLAIKILRPDLRKILTCRSSLFAVDEMYKKPKSCLSLGVVLEGNVDMDSSKTFFMENVIYARDKGGNLIRPELAQCVEQWLGFYFWKQDEHFNINNHVEEYKGPLNTSAYDMDSIIEICRQLNLEPWDRTRSPWKAILVRNYRNDINNEVEPYKDCAIFHLHHCLADGFSLLGILTEVVSSEGSLAPMNVKSPKMPLWKTVLSLLALPMVVPFQLVETMVEAFDRNEWHIPENQLSGIIRGTALDKIPVDFIKEIKNKLNVSFTSVILEGLTGGIRNFMLEHKIKVPQDMHGIVPLPMPGHPEKLRNHMTMCILTLPVGISEPKQRIVAIEKNLAKLKRSTTPHILFYIMPLVGGLPSFLMKMLSRQFLVTALTSIFPAPPNQVHFLGMPVLDVVVGGGMLPGNIGLAFSSISYNGVVGNGLGTDQSLLPKNTTIKDLAKKITEEFYILMKLGNEI